MLLLPGAGWLEEIIRKVTMPIITENPGKMFPYIDIHLFPDATDNVWRLSTAHMEANILRDLSRQSPVKKALAICKVIFSWLQDWNRKNADQSSSINEQALLDITKELEQFTALKNGMEKKELGQQLIANMRYTHIWMPSNKRSCYCEAGKSNISVNTAAVKHILIKAGLERHGSFSPKENSEVLLELIREVFQQLGKNTFTTDHAFLPGTRISNFSLLACAANNKYNMAKQIRQQCRTILSEVMTEVRIAITFDNKILHFSLLFLVSSISNIGVLRPSNIRPSVLNHCFRKLPQESGIHFVEGDTSTIPSDFATFFFLIFIFEL